jgi:hypothetical protein
MIKSSRSSRSIRIRLGGYVAHMEQKKSAYEVLIGTSEGKRQTDLNVDERMILKWILEL